MAHSHNKGFGGMSADRQRRIASKGGHTSHEGRARERDADETSDTSPERGSAAHHERAAFHHESAAHHHGQAAKYRAAGQHDRADLHAESARKHGRRASEHTSRLADEDEVTDRDDDEDKSVSRREGGSESYARGVSREQHGDAGRRAATSRSSNSGANDDDELPGDDVGVNGRARARDEQNRRQ